MAVRKRFIAGAKCPACQAQDSLAMWRENNVDVVLIIKQKIVKLLVANQNQKKNLLVVHLRSNSKREVPE